MLLVVWIGVVIAMNFWILQMILLSLSPVKSFLEPGKTSLPGDLSDFAFSRDCVGFELYQQVLQLPFCCS